MLEIKALLGSEGPKMLEGSFFLPLSHSLFAFWVGVFPLPLLTPRLAPTAFVASATNAVGVFGLWVCGG